MKINSNFKAFAGVNFDASKYIPSPASGVNRFMLDRIGSERARATTIVQYKPHSSFKEHEHIGGEEFLVLDGTFKDQFGEFPAGTYVRNPIGSKHAPWVDDDGCTIMVKLLQMAETGEGTDSLHLDFNGSKEKGTTTDFGCTLTMYENPVTGERVEMCWINPDTTFPPNEYAVNGEELFVYDGSVTVGEDEYPKWGWLRFPETSSSSDDETNNRSMLKSGKNGAQVYRKTGHLTEKALSMEKIQITEED